MSWDSKSTFVQPPVGAHAATLISIVDLGTQTGEYQGKPTKKRQNILTWELPHEKMDDGRPFTISKFYTASLGEKTYLTKDLTSWFGKPPKVPFEIEDQKALLGKHCQVVIAERKDSDKVVVSTVVALGKGVEMPKKPHNPLIYFNLDAFDEEVFNGLSEWRQTQIMKSPEYAKIINGDVPDEEESKDEEVPF